jgi:iron complex outermembrane receptor protein
MANRQIAIIGGTLALACSAGALAQTPVDDELQEVVVTAERRENTLQKTALSVTALSAEQIEKTGIQNFESLLQSIPGVQVQTSTGPQGIPYIAIRGLGTDGDNKPGATAIYVDGVVLGGLGLQMHDLSRVEVLRGPQGTLYGGIATGGAVNIITNDPNTDDFSGSAQLETGNHGLLRGAGVLNMPVSETSAVRVAVNHTRRDSFADSDLRLNSQTNARAKWLLAPNDNLRWVLGLEYYRLSGVRNDGVREVPIVGGPPSPFTPGTYVPDEGYGTIDGYRLFSDLDWNFGNVSLKSLTSIENADSNLSTSDINGSAQTITPTRDTKTQEFRLFNTPESGTKWVAGVWYKKYDQANSVNIGALSVLPPDSIVPCLAPFCTSPTTQNILIRVNETRDDSSLGVFGQVTIPVGESSRITGGARYSNDKVHFDQFLTWTASAFAPPLCLPLQANPCTVPTLFDRSFSNMDWLARFEHDVNESSLLYASFSTGYRPGGPSAPRGTPFDTQATYGLERVRSFELGSKNRFAQNRVQLNGAVYYNDYPAFQNLITYFGPNNAQLPGIVAVAATFYGAELELQALAGANGRFGASVSYINAKYGSDVTSTNPFTGQPFVLNIDGTQVPHAPELQLNLAYDHTFRLTSGATLVPSLNLHYQDDQKVTFNGGSAAAYTLLDAAMTFTSASGAVTVTAYGRNLGDETYITSTGRFGRETLAAPRAYGLIVGVKF